MWKNQITYLMLCIVSGGFCILYNERSTFLIFSAIVIFPIISGVITFFSKRFIDVSLDGETSMVHKDEEITLYITIENRSIFPISKMEFNCDYKNSICGIRESKHIASSFAGRSKQQIEICMLPKYIGNVTVYISKIHVLDYARVIRFRKKVQQTETIMVFPAELSIEEQNYIGNHQLFENETILQEKPGVDQTEIFNIREYGQGDKISRIHWKLSSKYDELMIKEYAMPLYYYPLILLDLSMERGKTGIEKIEAEFIAYVSLVNWHLEHQQPLETAYYRVEEDVVIKRVITTREELILFVQEVYEYITMGRENGILEKFCILNEAHKYSNLFYLTCAVYGKTELISSLNPFTAVFVSKAESENDERDLGFEKFSYDKLCLVEVENWKETIPAMIQRLMSGIEGRNLDE